MRLRTLPPSALEKLVSNNQSVYVVNTSTLPSGAKGLIVINFFDGTRREFFKMPPTFIPIAVTDSIPPKRLIESKDFKQSLVKGMLTLVEPSDAEQYLDTDEAREEYESLMLSEHSANTQAYIETNPGRPQISHQASAGGAGPDQDVSAVDTVSNKVRGLLESLISGEKDAKAVKLELRRHQNALSQVDLSYVIANCNDPELTRFAQEALSSITVAPAAPQAQPKPAVAKKAVKKEASSFDFSDTDVPEMTPEEVKADAEARAKAMSQQAVNGQSKINDELNGLLKKR